MLDISRTTALRYAIDLHKQIGDLSMQLGRGLWETVRDDEGRVLGTAEVFLAWLHGPTFIRLHAGVVVDQTTGLPTGTKPTGGSTMQIHDNEQFILSAATADAKGFPTTDPLTWTVDDESVATVQVAQDGQSATVVAGNPGSAVVTVTDGTLTATEAVDVVPGGTALITLTEGAVSEQPPAGETPAAPAE